MNPAITGLHRTARRVLALPWACALALLVGCTSTGINNSPSGQVPQTNELALFTLAAAPGARLAIFDFEGQATLNEAPLRVPKPANPRVPASVVEASRSTKTAALDAVTLQWRDSWQMGLRVELAAPLDLRSFRDQGTLEFDLRTDDMAHGGLHVAFSCGTDCGRKLNFVLPSRALAGKGWQHLSFPLRCFARTGDDWRAVSQPVTIDGSGTGQAHIANLRLLRSGTANQPCPDYRTESVTPQPLNQVWSLGWWMQRHEFKKGEIRRRQLAGERTDLVFIGDSITQGWEDAGKAAWDQHFAPLGALGLGYGGDKTENVLWRLQHGELDGITPKAVVLMIGTNNTGDRLEDPATVAAGIRRIVQEIRTRQPQARVLLLAIFPRDEKPSGKLRRNNERINALIEGLADGRQVVFQNINAAFLNADGTLSKDVMPDLLHLSPRGYGIWADSITPTLRNLLQP